jgi:hypothetical protein
MQFPDLGYLFFSNLNFAPFLVEIHHIALFPAGIGHDLLAVFQDNQIIPGKRYRRAISRLSFRDRTIRIL